jgi:hypothetical protein
MIPLIIGWNAGFGVSAEESSRSQEVMHGRYGGCVSMGLDNIF